MRLMMDKVDSGTLQAWCYSLGYAVRAVEKRAQEWEALGLDCSYDRKVLQDLSELDRAMYTEIYMRTAKMEITV